MNLTDQTTILAMVAGLGIAWEGSKATGKNPLMILGAGVLLIFVAANHLFGTAPLMTSVPALLKDLGLGLLAGSAMMVWRKAAGHSFLVGGLVLLGMAGVGYGAWYLFQNTKQVLLELGPDDRITEVMPILVRYGVAYERAFPEVSLEEDENLAQYFLLSGTASVMEKVMRELRADRENVDHVEWNSEVTLEPEVPQTPLNQAGIQSNDPKANEQWALRAIYANEAFTILKNASPKRKAKIAILDTGVDSGHEDLKSVFHKSSGDKDLHGHGTHCAGIAGAATNNGLGVASLNWEGRFIEIRGYHALNGGGAGTNESIAQAMISAVEEGADILSMSLGGYSPTAPKVIRDAVQFALKRQVVVIAAAGNANDSARNHSPANINGVITVSAVDAAKKKASFSNTNNGLKRPIAAPGVDILSTKPGGMYMAHSGTSMATPLVAGLAGILRAFRPDLKPDELYQILQRTGQEVADSGKVGRVINAEAAIRVVLP
ncbi:MAG: S8 family serine peptidase [Rhodothermia bacterium]|nr:S8 family serine peptidase [Rhodothermia bacterium]